MQAQGATTIHFRAVDGAGNEVDRYRPTSRSTPSAPAPAVKCVADAGTAWTCTATRQDSVSGVASLAYSVDGSMPAAIANGGTFTRRQGLGRGLRDTTSPATPPRPLRSRSPIARLRRPRRPRGSSSEAVLLRKGGASAARLVGQLAISSLPTATTVDLRPLAIGKGTFQFVFKIKSGKKTKTVTKTQTVKTGYSTRISVALPAPPARPSVALTVRKKSGKRWTTYATAAAKL